MITIFTLEEGRVPDWNSKGWKIEGGKKEECKRLREELEVGGFMTQKSL